MTSAGKDGRTISLAGGALALRGARVFLARARAAHQRRAALGAQSSAAHKPARIRPMPNQNKPPAQTVDALRKTTHFNKCELETLYTVYRKLVTSAQNEAAATPMGQAPPKIEGIDQNTFRELMHNTFDLVTEELVLERVWTAWDRGTSGCEAALKFEPWARGLSVMLRGTRSEKLNHCFNVYDLNSDGYITKDEMFLLLKNSLLKQPGDEDPDEGVRDLVELVLKKLDNDKDGRVSLEDFTQAVEDEPLLQEAFGQCLPARAHAEAFLRSLNCKR